MLCAPFTAQATVRFASPETPMPRRIDHLIICVRDLAQAALSWQTLGFTLTPTGVHPFGTSNRLAMFANSFLELLAVTDAAAIPAAAPGRFSFAAHNQDFLAAAEGMSMLAWHSTDAHADAARFKANDVGAYAPFDFGRDAVLPGGATARVEFSLAFATDPAMPGIAFFTKPPNAPGWTLLTASPRLRARLRHSFTRTCNGQFFGWRALASVFPRDGQLGERRYRSAAACAGCFAFGAERSRAIRLHPPFRWRLRPPRAERARSARRRYNRGPQSFRGLWRTPRAGRRDRRFCAGEHDRHRRPKRSREEHTLESARRDYQANGRRGHLRRACAPSPGLSATAGRTRPRLSDHGRRTRRTRRLAKFRVSPRTATTPCR